MKVGYIVACASAAVVAIATFVWYNSPSSKVERQAKAALEESMRVEGSAKFKDVRAVSSNSVVCGKVSGKNALGVQLNYQGFVYLVKTNEVKLEESSGEYAIKVFCHEEFTSED